jgi:hypothetical protein
MFRRLMFFIASIAFATEPFDGTWRIDSQKAAFSSKPYRFDLSTGTYNCISCARKARVKADGTERPKMGEV